MSPSTNPLLLSENLAEALGAPRTWGGWIRFRSRPLAMKKRAWELSKLWRGLSASLVEHGVPACGTKLSCDLGRAPTDCCLDPGQQTIFLPWAGHILERLQLDAQLAGLTPILVLLHEQAHARLYSQGHLWMDRWPTRLGFHANPIWEQVPGHPGWTHFNELYADASAAAWLIAMDLERLDARVALVERLIVGRAQSAWRASRHSTWSSHDTTKALREVLNRQQEIDIRAPQTIEALVRSIARNAFEQWLVTGGTQICERFLEQSLAGDRMRPVGLLGLQDGPSAFRELQRRQAAMEDWARRAPNHPIFRFPGARGENGRISGV